jgi:hypothetical protein
MVVISCSNHDIDDAKPVIDLTIAGAFPLNCDTLYLGESFVFKTSFTDNRELGSYSIEIHQNFDHHAHSTELTACRLSEKKEAVNPFHLIRVFEIPKGFNEYTTSDSILIPMNNVQGEIDEGDYHFYISLIDREGWSSKKGLSIKILKP